MCADCKLKLPSDICFAIVDLKIGCMSELTHEQWEKQYHKWTWTMKSLLVARTRIKNITEIKSSQFNWIDFHLPYITRNNPKVVLLLLRSCHSLRNTSSEIFAGMWSPRYVRGSWGSWWDLSWEGFLKVGPSLWCTAVFFQSRVPIRNQRFGIYIGSRSGFSKGWFGSFWGWGWNNWNWKF